MIKAKIKLFIVDHDSIFRLGLRTAIAQYANFEIVGEGNFSNDTIRELTQGLTLNVLIVGISYSANAEISGLELTQQLRQLYPQLPLFLLTPNFSASQLLKLKNWGVQGNCSRSASISTMIEGLQTVAYGNTFWQTIDSSPRLWQRALARFSKSGRIELEATLQEIEAKLANPNLSDWERAFLVGRKRELLTARWLSSRLVAEEISLTPDSSAIEPSDPKAEIVPIAAVELAKMPVFSDSVNKTIFERVATDIQIGLNNRSKIPLEIDILRPELQKSLCHLILQRLSETMVEVPIANTIDRDYNLYLKELWLWSIRAFLAQNYEQLGIEDEQLTYLVEQEYEIVRLNIFSYIYGVADLLEYLYGTPGLKIDNIVYQSDDPEAIARIEFLLHNLLIHLANGVMQVILNNFYDLEILKYKLYRPEYRSDRELARFRNQLSWKYRQETYITHPQNIFESRYRLLVLSNGLIRTTYIYAPRKAELERLTGIPWLSTIIIEIRDAIAPLVRKFISLAGSSVVFVLTQVIGKGLGLVGKGIIQGIGSTIKDVPRNNKKP